jgi:NIPSNAP
VTRREFHAPPIVELRQYAMVPGQRDALIELFDREFVETQEAVGMAVLGQFRDLDDPDRYVWLRGFSDLATRLAGLTQFYGGPIWQAHRGAANATIVDSDDVRLLREARPGSGLDLSRASRSAPASAATIAITTYSLAAPADDASIAGACESRREGALLAVYVTEAAANDYPRLPVREGEHVLVTVEAGEPRPAPAALARAAAAIEVRRLAPTSRSLLR